MERHPQNQETQIWDITQFMKYLFLLHISEATHHWKWSQLLVIQILPLQKQLNDYQKTSCRLSGRH